MLLIAIIIIIITLFICIFVAILFLLNFLLVVVFLLILHIWINSFMKYDVVDEIGIFYCIFLKLMNYFSIFHSNLCSCIKNAVN